MSNYYTEQNIWLLTGRGYLKKENLFGEENTDVLSPLSFL